MPIIVNDWGGKATRLAGCACRVTGGLLMNALSHFGAFLVQVTNTRFMTWAEAKKAFVAAWTNA